MSIFNATYESDIELIGYQSQFISLVELDVLYFFIFSYSI